MRVAIQISTGKLLEGQSDATPGTLTKNAIAAGVAARDVEEREVTEEEFAVLLDTAETPSEEKPLTPLEKLTRLGLTVEELKSLLNL